MTRFSVGQRTSQILSLLPFVVVPFIGPLRGFLYQPGRLKFFVVVGTIQAMTMGVAAWSIGGRALRDPAPRGSGAPLVMRWSLSGHHRAATLWSRKETDQVRAEEATVD